MSSSWSLSVEDGKVRRRRLDAEESCVHVPPTAMTYKVDGGECRLVAMGAIKAPGEYWLLYGHEGKEYIYDFSISTGGWKRTLMGITTIKFGQTLTAVERLSATEA